MVTIKNKTPLFYNNQPSNLEELSFEENNFTVLSTIGNFQVGDKAIYIEPDYNLMDKPVFESYIRPNNDAKKSRLGSNNRVRAIKFAKIHKGDGIPVYSNGILVPLTELDFDITGLSQEQIYEKLGVYKYEEPETKTGGGIKCGASSPFPTYIYRTDETNIKKLRLEFPMYLIGAEKCDGSSITIGVTPQDPEGFICSRNMRKPITTKRFKELRKEPWLDKLMRIFFGFTPDLKVYETVESDNDFVKYGKPFLDLLLAGGHTNLILRGELNGGHLKGSGNKNNPATKEQPNIKFFGVDSVCTNWTAEKVSYLDFKNVTDSLGLTTCKEVFNKEFQSYEELMAECNAYFKSNLIEGIVVRTPDSKFSAKVMNDEYDSKK